MRARDVGIAQAADLFCGAGGTSYGLLRAFARRRRDVALLAINHNELACQSHARNHPRARTLLQRLQDIANPRTLIPGGLLNILAASPECRPFTKAANGRPRDDQARAAMEHVIHWTFQAQPQYLFVENVPEVALWGPTDEDGYPDPTRLGVLFDAWCAAFLRGGYPNLEYRVVCCADYGDPQFRRRLFVMGSLDGRPIRWPRPTHGPAGSGLLPYRTARQIIEWRIHGTPLGEKRRAGYFARRGERWACIEAGFDKYGGEPFVLRRRQFDNSPESNAKTVDEPLHTVTAGSTDIALIVPEGRDIDRARHRMLVPLELQRAFSFPDDAVFFGTRAEQVWQIGNAVPLCTAEAHIGALLDISGNGCGRRAA